MKNIQPILAAFLLLSLLATTDAAPQKLQAEEPPQTLIEAIKADDTAAAKRFIQQGADVNEADKNGTALHIAAGFGQVEVVKMLLKAGANIEAKDNRGNTPLVNAVGSRGMALAKMIREEDTIVENSFPPLHLKSERTTAKTEITKLLLDAGANIEARNQWQQTPLYNAIFSPESMKLLLKAKANVRAKDSEGRTPFYYAVEFAATSSIPLLLDAGADIEAKNANGWTPLLQAAIHPYYECIIVLLEKRADVKPLEVLLYPTAEMKSKFDKENPPLPPLLVAVLLDRPETFKKLLKDGAKLETKDTSILHTAIALDNPKAIQTLLDAGADRKILNRHGHTLLHVAASYGSLKAMQTLLAAGFEVDEKDRSGKTALQYLAHRGPKPALQALIDAGADIEAKDKQTDPPLVCAAQGHNVERLRMLIDAGAKLDTKGGSGTTALAITIEQGNIKAIKMLLDAGADKTVVDQTGCSPLHIAVGKKKLSYRFGPFDPKWKLVERQNAILHLLIEAKCNLEATDRDKQTPLHHAVLWNHPEARKVLIDAGANLEAKDKEGATPLHYAALYGDLKAFKALLDAGADIEAKDKIGGTPLHRAAAGLRWPELYGDGSHLNNCRSYIDHQAYEACCGRVTEFLIEKKVDLNAQDDQGRTPLHYAASADYASATEKLLAAGANFKAKDKKGRSPLCYAILADNGRTANRLIEAGADIEPEAKTKGERYHTTLLHFAAGSGRNDVVKKLLDAGAELNAANKNGATPLHYAISSRHSETAMLLIDAGADIHAKNCNGQTPLDCAKDEKIKSLLKEHASKAKTRPTSSR